MCASIDDASMRIFYSSRSADANDENYAATLQPTMSTIFVNFEVKIQNILSITTSVFILDHFQIIISTEDSKKIGACPIKFSTIALHRPPRKILCTCPKRPATHSSMQPFVARHMGDMSEFLAVWGVRDKQIWVTVVWGRLKLAAPRPSLGSAYLHRLGRLAVAMLRVLDKVDCYKPVAPEKLVLRCCFRCY